MQMVNMEYKISYNSNVIPLNYLNHLDLLNTNGCSQKKSLHISNVRQLHCVPKKLDHQTHGGNFVKS